MVVRVGDSQGLGVLQEADQDGRHSSGNHVHHHVRHKKPHLQDEKKGEGEGGAGAMAKIALVERGWQVRMVGVARTRHGEQARWTDGTW